MNLDKDELLDSVKDLIKKYYPDLPSSGSENVNSQDLESELLPTAFLLVLNFANQGYEYVSPNISESFPLGPQTLIDKGILAALNLFPDGCREIFATKVIPSILTTFQRAVMEGLDITKFRVHYNICMESHTKGKINTMHILKPFVADANGMPMLVLKYVFDISGFSSESDITISFEYLDKGKTVLYFKDSFPLENQEISKREAEIVEFIGKGYSSKEIAEILSISIHTVNTHRKNIMKKYNVQNFQQSYYKKRV